MTAAARRVLADCEAAVEMLENEHDEQRWRVLWIGAMALLRVVGHVLRKVDGEIPRQRAVIDAAYRRWSDGRMGGPSIPCSGNSSRKSKTTS